MANSLFKSARVHVRVHMHLYMYAGTLRTEAESAARDSADREADAARSLVAAQVSPRRSVTCLGLEGPGLEDR